MLSESERLRALVNLVLGETAAVLGYHDASRLDANTGFVDLGLDSLMAVELKNLLESSLSSTVQCRLSLVVRNVNAGSHIENCLDTRRVIRCIVVSAAGVDESGEFSIGIVDGLSGAGRPGDFPLPDPF